MKQIKVLLMSIGASLVISNAAIFAVSHGSLKAHGIIQIVEMLVGGIVFLLGTLLPRLVCDRPENNCAECGGGPCRVWTGNTTQGELLRHISKLSTNSTSDKIGPSSAVCGQKDDGYNAYRISAGIEACGGAAAMGAESSGADGEAALRTPPLSNEHASCNCQIAHEGPCQSSLSQGELLKKFTRPSPNCTSDLPDNDYED